MELNKMKELYWLLLQEFTHQHIKSINKYLTDGNSRYIDTIYLRVDDNSFKTINKINISYFKALLSKELSEFKNRDLVNKLISEIQKNAKFNFCTKTFDESINCHPSTVNNYIINFIYRNIELNHYQNLYTKESFEQSFKELLRFMQSVDINYELYYPLHGCVGSEQIVNIKDITIKKVTLDDCNFFDGYYNYDTPQSGLRTDLKIGDYFAIINHKTLKSQFMHYYNYDSKLLNKKFIMLLALSSNGNVILGRAIHRFKDWTINNTGASNLISEPKTLIHNPFLFSIDKAKQNLKDSYDCFYSDNFTLDKSFKYALKWLQQSKESIDINDRIVKLSLALEFSIKTNRNSISKDLREKSAVLYTYDGTRSYKASKEIIYNFYDLRGKIMHGSGEIIASNETIKLMNNAETIIRENLLLLCKLNQKLNFEQINQFMAEVLHTTPRPTLKSIIQK